LSNPNLRTASLSTELRVRPKLLTDLPPDLAKLIEDVQVDHRGRLILLYSKHQANKELRNMLNLSAKSDASDVSKLSDQELISTLAPRAQWLATGCRSSPLWSRRAGKTFWHVAIDQERWPTIRHRESELEQKCGFAQRGTRTGIRTSLAACNRPPKMPGKA
jgi:hypothetical protein